MGNVRVFRPDILGVMSVGLFGLSQFLVISLYPALAQATHFSLSELIFAFTVGPLFILWSGPFWASKSDSQGRERVLSLGLFGLGLTTLHLVYLITQTSTDNSSVQLFLNRFVYGCTAGSIVSVVQAWWRDQEGSVTKKMISHSIALNVGRLLAPVAVLLFEGSLVQILSAVSIISMVMAGLSLFGNSKGVSESHSDNSSTDWNLLLLIFVSCSFIGIIHSTLAFKIRNILNLQSTETSIVTAKFLLLSGVIVVTAQWFMKRSRLLSRGNLLALSICSFFFASGILTSTVTSTELVLFIIIFSIGLASLAPGYLSFSSRGGKSAGMIGAVQTLGLCAGGALSSFLIEDLISFDLLLFSLWGCMLVFSVKIFTTRRQHA